MIRFICGRTGKPCCACKAGPCAEREVIEDSGPSATLRSARDDNFDANEGKYTGLLEEEIS